MHDSTGVFDISSWIDRQVQSDRQDSQWLVGSSYIERNIDFFSKLIAKRALPGTDDTRDLELIWLRFAGSGWGATPDLQDAVANLRGTLRRTFSKNWKIKTVLFMTWSVVGTDTIVRADVNNNTTPDIVITLTGVHTLTQNDFIL
jgi:hypothetical protein